MFPCDTHAPCLASLACFPPSQRPGIKGRHPDTLTPSALSDLRQRLSPSALAPKPLAWRHRVASLRVILNSQSRAAGKTTKTHGGMLPPVPRRLLSSARQSSLLQWPFHQPGPRSSLGHPPACPLRIRRMIVAGWGRCTSALSAVLARSLSHLGPSTSPQERLAPSPRCGDALKGAMPCAAMPCAAMQVMRENDLLCRRDALEQRQSPSLMPTKPGRWTRPARHPD
jgi:hypothetical protein